jgi:glycerophosphoryl diester phosphodiesterase
VRAARGRWPYPRLLAHRCGGALAPENTLAGLDVAAELGCNGVEFDAKLTREGTPVLMHDETLERTTSGIGPVARASWDDLLALDAGAWYSPRFQGERVPTLEAALLRCEALGLWPNVEIKPCPGREEETARIVANTVMRVWRGALPPLLSSFSEAALEAAAQSAPSLPRAWLVEAPSPRFEAILARLACVSLHCDYRCIDRTTLARVRHAGCAVLCYTVNDLDDARRLWSLGVDALVTDRFDLIRAPLGSGTGE